MKKPMIWLAAVAATVALVACGDDDDEGLPTGDVSKDAYIAEVDVVCGDADAKIDAEAGRFFGEELGLKGNEQPTEEQVTEFVQDIVVPTVEAELDELRAIEAPEDDADELAEIYDTLEENLDSSPQTPTRPPTTRTRSRKRMRWRRPTASRSAAPTDRIFAGSTAHAPSKRSRTQARLRSQGHCSNGPARLRLAWTLADASVRQPPF
jgi:hypothetical protein